MDNSFHVLLSLLSLTFFNFTFYFFLSKTYHKLLVLLILVLSFMHFIHYAKHCINGKYFQSSKYVASGSYLVERNLREKKTQSPYFVLQMNSSLIFRWLSIFLHMDLK